MLDMVIRIDGRCFKMSNSRELERAFRINTIRSTLKEAKKQGKIVNRNKLILEVMMNFNTTRRTAIEYLDIAGFDDAEQTLCKGEKEGIQDSEPREETGQVSS